MTESDQEIGQRLASARRHAGMEQKAAAIAASISERTLGDWENGRSSPTVKHLTRLLRVYGVSSDYILGLSDHPTGLPIGKWVVDQEQVEQLRLGPRPADQEVSVAFQIPGQPRLLDDQGIDRLRKELGADLNDEETST